MIHYLTAASIQFYQPSGLAPGKDTHPHETCTDPNSVAQASVFIATLLLSEFLQEVHLYHRRVQTTKTPKKILTANPQGLKKKKCLLLEFERCKTFCTALGKKVGSLGQHSRLQGADFRQVLFFSSNSNS